MGADAVELQEQHPEDSPVDQTPRLHLVATNSTPPAEAAQPAERALASRATGTSNHAHRDPPNQAPDKTWSG